MTDPTPAPARPALIIGNGPSVDHLPLDLFDHVTTYGCNHIGRKFAQWGRPTDHIVITDSNRIAEIGRTYADFRGGLFVGDDRYAFPPVRRIRNILGRDFVPLRQLKKQTLERFRFLDRVRWSPLLYSTIFHKGRFTFDLNQGLNFGYSVVTSAIQLAVIHGHKTILLTGVDSSYKGDKDYFTGMADRISYVNKDFTSNPRVFMEPILTLLQVYLEPLEIALIDCTPGGKLRFIPKGRFLNSPPYFAITRPI
jgi:hypothetical protein